MKMKHNFTSISLYYYFNIIDKSIGMYFVIKDKKAICGGYQVFDKDNLPIHHLRFFDNLDQAEEYKQLFISRGKSTDVFMVPGGTVGM
jgi:hypothetical protein